MTIQYLINKVINKNCIQCNTPENIHVNQYDYDRWVKGELIQKCFPYLNDDQREILITGICGKCFDKNFEVYENRQDEEIYLDDEIAF